MNNKRIIFMGTSSFGIPLLEALIAKTKVVLIVTQLDKKINNKEIKSPIKEIALKNNIKVLTVEDVNNYERDLILLRPDLIIVCAFRQMLSKKILAIPPLGCFNIHASLLPKLRGGAPIHRALMKGHHKTGVSITYMIEKLDAGDIVAQQETEIKIDDDYGTLHDRLSLMAKDLLMVILPEVIAKKINLQKQCEQEASYAWHIERKDEKLDFSKTKKELFNQIRGLNPTPGAYALLHGKIHKIWKSTIGQNGYSNKINGEIINLYDDGLGIKVSNGELIITEIQVEGKNRMRVREFLNGFQNKESLLGRIFE